ncbi:MAG TPA: ATP-binding protein [Gemmatimonadales bacterium]|nr:ATP-binding protein [Gemmatimonadales bacterium]
MSREESAERLDAVRGRISGPHNPGAMANQTIEDLRVTLEELRVAEEELKQQNEELAATHLELDTERQRYLELFESAPTPYLVTDELGIVLQVNRSAARLFRVPPRFLPGKALAAYVASADRARFRALIGTLPADGRPHTAAFKLQPRQGDVVDAELTYSAAVAGGVDSGTVRWMVRDVTEPERLARQIRALNSELESRIAARTADLGEAQRLSRELFEKEQSARRAAEASEAQARHVQKLESIGVLAGGIAHDFNNLLHVVLGNADIALNNLTEGSPAREPLEEVVRATLRAADLTRQLLAYSGKGAFVIRHLDLSAEVREMATLLRTSISKQATLAWELAPDLPSVTADPTQIRQVVMNLITNASDALGEAGGTITLRTGVTRLEDLDHYQFGAPLQGEDAVEQSAGPMVYLEIGDTGSGMSPDTLSRIFDPFFSTKFAGRGLGLAAVMGIVRSHHGLIRIRTEPGVGTSFRVLFPAVEGSPSRPGKPSGERSEWRGSGTILVVEDEEGVREVAERILQDIGFQTIPAEDGRHALDIMEEVGNSITAVLLDLSMPRMGGAEAFRRLREMRPELPILMMSGYTQQVVAPQFANSGPGNTGFIQKPFLAEDLIAVLRRFADSSAR